MIVRTALREARGAFRHFAFFLLCVALGVGALAAVGSVGARLEQTVLREARTLLAADVSVRTWQPLTREAEATLARALGEGASGGDTRELVAMASAGAESSLVELKAVGPEWPLYGTPVVEPADALDRLRAPGGESLALGDESLLTRLDIQPGQSIRLGGKTYSVAGVLKREPDRSAGNYSLGPRLLVSLAGLERSGLIQPGSRIRYRRLIRLPESADVEGIAKRLSETLESGRDRVDVDSYLESQEWLRRSLRQFTDYLGLLGLAALFLGGVGVAIAVQAYLAEKLDTVAVFKVLGFGSREVLAVYLLQTAVMAVVGCAIGIALAAATAAALPGFLSGMLAERLAIDSSLYLPAVWRAAAMGLGVALLFSLWPLLGVRHIRPNLVWRRDVSSGAGSARPPLGVAALLIAGLAGLALWQAGNLRAAGIFLGSLAGVVLALSGFAWVTVRLLASLASDSFPLRHALQAPARPGSRAKTLLTALSLGVALLVSTALIEASLSSRLRDNLPQGAPGFFFIDIQPDQAEGVRALLARHGTPALHPVLRARLHSLRGERVEDMDLSKRPDRWQFRREYVITFAKDRPANNRLVAGGWGAPGERWVSVEEEAAKRLGLKVGDELAMDVQGQPMTAKVANLRAVRWGDYTTNFFMIFSPAFLEGDGLPVTWLATAQIPRERARELQRAVIKGYPNVTAFDLRQILDTVASVMGRLAKLVRFVALFTVAAGFAVLAGALAATRYRRVHDAAVLKAVGAARSQVAAAFAAEYGLLGLAAGVGGLLGGGILAWSVVHFVLKVPFVAPVSVPAAAVLGAALGSTAVGMLATRRALSARPLEVLRSE